MTTTTLRGIALAFALAALPAWLAAPAAATRPKPRHCKIVKVRVRATRVVVRRVHGHRVRVRVHYKKTVRRRVCPRPRPKPVPPVTTTMPTAPAPAMRSKLHAHLDPSFVQDPADPLRVTYSYSASATQSLAAAPVGTEEPAALPEGLLQLYSDGLLACSMKVGGATTGGECPTSYQAPGAHRVIVTYTAGTTTETETSTEQIEPFSTTTTVAVTPTECAPGVTTECGCPPEDATTQCFYTVRVNTVDQNGNPRHPTGLWLSWAGEDPQDAVFGRTEECLSAGCLDVSKPRTLDVRFDGGGTCEVRFVGETHAVGTRDKVAPSECAVQVAGNYTASAITEPGWTSSHSEPSAPLAS